MMRADYHIHTLFSDGKNTPEEMVLAAIEKEMSAIGFSDHSYTAFDESYCILKDKIAEYKREIAALRERYKDKITVLCGIEQDFYSDESADGYDYVIGSVHYIKAGEEYIPVDESAEILLSAAKKHFGGDIYALVEAYYATVAQLVDRVRPDIIGHFDLITKFNRDGALFDEQSPRYRAAASKAVERLLESGVPFEVNTGAISRGYLERAYPAGEWLELIASRAGRFVLSSDSHSTATICFNFEKYKDICSQFR